MSSVTVEKRLVKVNSCRLYHHSTVCITYESNSLESKADSKQYIVLLMCMSGLHVIVTNTIEGFFSKFDIQSGAQIKLILRSRSDLPGGTSVDVLGIAMSQSLRGYVRVWHPPLIFPNSG